eukprot:Skav218105  [mRNA]  locus=scaffold759:82527:83796:- [translate_table: standard]
MLPSCCLGPRPNRSYVVRVQGRYAGGDGAGGGWSAELAETFRTLKAWCDEGTQLAAPELVLEPADWASQKGVATQAGPGRREMKRKERLKTWLGKNMDALIRWTSHGKAGEITWISTGMEAGLPWLAMAGGCATPALLPLPSGAMPQPSRAPGQWRGGAVLRPGERCRGEG